MLTDPKEIEIISKARQKNVRDHNRSRQHFINIFDDFFRSVDFKDTDVVDLGPGQYDFGVLAQERGATGIYGLDNDEAVLELGRHKGFEVREGRIQNVSVDLFGMTFGGVFNKFALNCFWFWDDEHKQIDFVDRVASLLKDDGWAWIAPWNGVPKSADISEQEINTILERQADRFKYHGFDAHDLTADLAKKYGVNGTVANNVIFTKGLSIDSLRQCSKL